MRAADPAATLAPAGLEALLRPRSIALVGATDRSAWSVQVHANLRRYSPSIAVHCVNPRGGEVHGQPAVASLADLAGQVDLVYVMTRRETVPSMLLEAAEAGAGAAIVLTAGFGEISDGSDHQQALLDAVAASGMVVLGPNGSGLINLHDGVVAFAPGVPELPETGGASFVLHSGGLMKPLLGLATAWGVGVGVLATTGNEAALTAAQLAAGLLEDPRTRAVGLFLETVRDPGRFRALAARAAELDKPLVALTVGRSEVAQRAAAAHTGALVGDAEAASAVLASLGVLEVSSVEELVATTDLLARGFRPEGGRMAVVGASGGACELLAERSAEVGLDLPMLSPEAAAALQEVLPDISHAHNPLDITGAATSDPNLPVNALDRIAEHAPGAFDAIVFQAFVLPAGPAADPEVVAVQRGRFDQIAAAARRSPVPVVLQDPVAVPLNPAARAILRDTGLVRVPGSEIGLAAVGHAVRWVAHRRRILAAAPDTTALPAIDAGLVGRALSEAEALGLLSAAGVPVVPHVLATTTEQAAAAVAELGAPVALKICSPDILHKSDVGGVALGVGPDQLTTAYDEMVARVAARMPGARIDGVLVAPMRSGGVELVVGVNRDPIWGPMLLVGLGGVFVEVLHDVAVRPLPVTAAEVREMFTGLRGAAVLQGARGRAPVDLDRVADAVLALSRLALALEESAQSIEINPLRADAGAVEALDALIVWREASGSADQHGGEEE